MPPYIINNYFCIKTSMEQHTYILTPVDLLLYKEAEQQQIRIKARKYDLHELSVAKNKLIKVIYFDRYLCKPKLKRLIWKHLPIWLVKI